MSAAPLVFRRTKMQMYIQLYVNVTVYALDKEGLVPKSRD